MCWFADWVKLVINFGYRDLYDIILYICLLQLGWHPVAVVQYIFTHKLYIEQHNRHKQYIDQHN